MLPEEPPHHSTIARTRRLIDVETHEAVFTLFARVCRGFFLLPCFARFRTAASLDGVTQLNQTGTSAGPRMPGAALETFMLRNGLMLSGELRSCGRHDI